MSWKVLRDLAVGAGGLPEVRIGLSTWGDKEYRGTIYPPRTRPSDFLEEYARRFATVELSSTFYSTPPPGRLEQWAAVTGEEFRFLPKVSRRITHLEGLTDVAGDIRAFTAALEPLGSRRGPLFFQLPPSFSPSATALARLDAALAADAQTAGEAPGAAVELRSPGWFTSFAEALAELLRRHRATLVVTDTPEAREVVHGIVTSETLLLRFVAAGEQRLDAMRLGEWARRIVEWGGRGVRSVYVYLHAPATQALRLESSLAEGLGGGAELVTPRAARGQLELL